MEDVNIEDYKNKFLSKILSSHTITDDPYYLIDYHVNRILPYFSIPKNQKFGFVLLNPKGQPIFSDMN